MPPTLVTTPGAAGANAYLSEAEADTYHDERLFSTNWTGALSDDKKRAIVVATRLLDEEIDWTEGSPASSSQALQWPRSSTVTARGDPIASTMIPQEIKNATAEFARQLIAKDRTKDPDAEQIDSLKVGPINLNFDHFKSPVIPRSVVRLVAPWGHPRFKSEGAIPLVRV